MAQQTESLTVGVATETYPGERRVALVPASVTRLGKSGIGVVAQSGAGQEAGFADSEYRDSGARIVEGQANVFAQADVILRTRTAGANPEGWQAEVESLRAGQFLIGLCDPLGQPQFMQELADRKVNCLAMELLPRTTKAQSMDVLSSMATVSGYKAVLLAAHDLPRLFPMIMTAAGTITPARVFVVGAGVAGLHGIASARRLGAVVQAYDVREAVREEVQSLGAKFVDLGLDTGEPGQSGQYARQMDEEFYRRQREVMTRVVADSDVVITTAAVPGKKAPILITEEMVKAMPAGSIVVDLAAEQGGNCELTQPNETIQVHGVRILGCVNLPATVPYHASQMLSNNLTEFLLHLVKEGAIALDGDDEILNGTLITRRGDVVHHRVRKLLGPTHSDTASIRDDGVKDLGSEPRPSATELSNGTESPTVSQEGDG